MSDACGKVSASESTKTDDTVKHLTDSELKTLLTSSEKPILVDFWAPWCGPCKKLGPIINDLGKDYINKIVVVKINVDQNRELAQQYKVSGIPTVMLFHKEKLVKQLTGLNRKSTYEKILNDILES